MEIIKKRNPFFKRIGLSFVSLFLRCELAAEAVYSLTTADGLRDLLLEKSTAQRELRVETRGGAGVGAVWPYTGHGNLYRGGVAQLLFAAWCDDYV
jgi:hypothetical protein